MEKRKVEILRFSKAEILGLIIAAYPEQFAGKSLADLNDYGNDPENVNYVRFVFKEEIVESNEPEPVQPAYVPSDPHNSVTVPPWTPDTTPEE